MVLYRYSFYIIVFIYTRRLVTNLFKEETKMSENLRDVIMEELRERSQLELEDRANQEQLQRIISKEYVLETFKKMLTYCLSEAKDFEGYNVPTSVVYDEYPYFEEEAKKLGFEVRTEVTGTDFGVDLYYHHYVLTVPAIKEGETPTVPQEYLLAFQKKLLRAQKARKSYVTIECLKVKQSILTFDFKTVPSEFVFTKISVPAEYFLEDPAEVKIVTDFFSKHGLTYSKCSRDKSNRIYWYFFLS